MRTYARPLLDTTLRLLRGGGAAPLGHPSPVLTTALLYLIAELLAIGGASLHDAFDELLILFAHAVHSSGVTAQRRAAVCALERLISHAAPAAFDPSPYERSPQLLPTLLTLLGSEADEATRRSVVRILGGSRRARAADTVWAGRHHPRRQPRAKASDGGPPTSTAAADSAASGTRGATISASRRPQPPTGDVQRRGGAGGGFIA